MPARPRFRDLIACRPNADQVPCLLFEGIADMSSVRVWHHSGGLAVDSEAEPPTSGEAEQDVGVEERRESCHSVLELG